jgi:ABC-type lipoprotein release transport system permease subunit
MPYRKYITAYAAENPLYITLAKNLLEDAGIKYKCSNDYMKFTNAEKSYNYSKIINLQVKEEDYKKAKSAVEPIEKKGNKKEPVIDKKANVTNKFLLIFVISVMLLIIILSLIIRQ